VSQIEVKQVRSTIGQCPGHVKVIRALGLGKINKVNTLKDNNCTRGMINKVQHLVTYKLIP
jgi:large subunit ribosomal protein L30